MTPTATVTPTPVNAAPQIDLNGGAPGTGYATSFLVGGPAVPIVGQGLAIADVDSINLQSATIRITNRKDGASERLSVALSGTKIRISSNANGRLKLEGPDSVGNFEKVLRTTTYRNLDSDPNLTQRVVSFVVNDGIADSNSPQSTIDMVDPSVELQKTPDTQTIAKDSSAIFRIIVKNSGNVPLQEIAIEDPLAPDCDVRWTNPLAPGGTRAISCGVADVQNDFTNTAIVEARDSYGHIVRDEDQARVEVVNPNIQIVKGPTRQVVRKGEAATFDILVINTSSVVNLRDVMVSDPLAPECDRDLGGLSKGAEVTYRCRLENITTPFTNEITVRGQDIISGEEIQDSSIATVDLLSIDSSLQADPALLLAEDDLVEFVVVIANDGSVPVNLRSLSIDQLGPLNDAQNRELMDNSCVDAELAGIDPGGTYNCSFFTAVGETLGQYTFDLITTAEDEDGRVVAHDSSAQVIVADDSLLSVALSASPASLPAPGGAITETVTVRNLSAAPGASDRRSATITIETLHHSVLGDLHQAGDCFVPAQIETGSAYSCSYAVEVTGEAGTLRTHRVSAFGYDSANVPAGNIDEVDILLFDPAQQLLRLPILAQVTGPQEDGNENACEATRLYSGRFFEFALDDPEDWYYFDILQPREVRIEVRHLMSSDAQILVYQDEQCNDLTRDDLVLHDGGFEPERSLEFVAEPGRHYLWIVNLNRIQEGTTYQVMLDLP